MTDGLEIRTYGPLRVVGLPTRASNADPSPIGALWQAFGQRSGEVGVEASPVAVYHDYESDANAPYSLLVGLPADDATRVPEGWTALEMPRTRFLVFPVPEGPMPDSLVETWIRAWTYFDGDVAYERTYEFDLELHGDRTEILVGVRPRD